MDRDGTEEGDHLQPRRSLGQLWAVVCQLVASGVGNLCTPVEGAGPGADAVLAAILIFHYGHAVTIAQAKTHLTAEGACISTVLT